MSRRRVLENHITRLTELGEIVRSMKNIALMEQRKITRMAASHALLVDSLESIAADFLSFHPEVAITSDEVSTVYLLIGSQRGFCGDFNDAIEKAFRANVNPMPKDSEVIAVGERLHERIRADFGPMVELDGPVVSEEIVGVLNNLLETLAKLQQQHTVTNVVVFHHNTHTGTVLQTPLLPPFQAVAPAESPFSSAPILNVPPSAFWADLVDQYLFSKLHEIFYASLLIENQRRVDHLTGAVRHLDEKTEGLGRKSRALRLEEITEEIEVILLSVGQDK